MRVSTVFAYPDDACRVCGRVTRTPDRETHATARRVTLRGKRWDDGPAIPLTANFKVYQYRPPRARVKQRRKSFLIFPNRMRYCVFFRADALGPNHCRFWY